MIRTTLAILTTLVLLTSNAWAKKDRDDKDDKHEKGDYLKKMKAELNLTDEQVAKLKEMKKSSKTDMKALRKSMQEAKSNFEKALSSAATDDEIKTKYAELEKIQQEFSKARLEKILATRSVLTPEQRLKFKAHFDRGDKHGPQQ